jgi:hypothetical protein
MTERLPSRARAEDEDEDTDGRAGRTRAQPLRERKLAAKPEELDEGDAGERERRATDSRYPSSNSSEAAPCLYEVEEDPCYCYGPSSGLSRVASP